MRAKSAALPVDGNARDVVVGLTSRPKSLPPRLFYDAAGSALFEQITTLPEYYLTATEQGIFERFAREMLAAAGGGATIVELGAGTAKKTMLLLRAASESHRTVRFVPVDLSSSALRLARERVRSELPQVEVQALLLDYGECSSALARIAGPKLMLFLGSSIGNLEPMAAGALLGRLRQSLAPGDGLLLGTDMRKPVELLLPAYDDPAGVTSRFNLNVLARLNREYQAEFDLELFSHQVRWSEAESRIEMHLASRVEQLVPVHSLGLSAPFAMGETIHTENSYKYSAGMIESIAHNGGFKVEQAWSDERDWFRVSLLRA